MGRHGTPASLPNGPELCLDVLSPSISALEMRGERTAADLSAGALEVWLFAETGTIEMFDAICVPRPARSFVYSSC